MKHIAMARRKHGMGRPSLSGIDLGEKGATPPGPTQGKPTQGKSTQGKSTQGKQDGANDVRAAFDVWVDRGLHALYDGIKDEPVPDELLRLIEEDRRK